VIALDAPAPMAFMERIAIDAIGHPLMPARGEMAFVVTAQASFGAYLADFRAHDVNFLNLRQIFDPI
jgi:hypothetical protein